VRVEKGNAEIHGIYTFINREFCAREWTDCQYVNREEDLGKEGLRKAKESYYPVLMVNKYLVRCRT
ncbi:MAG TPA: phosphatidylglycerol lysyltransferase domain-containing protein, partial [Thermoclostridium caenicola]|nr:phosphatidylglycerol lysyltransferase domain-containing protein [Thermoclostridium caenicola]